jgi:hypothetical protein
VIVSRVRSAATAAGIAAIAGGVAAVLLVLFFVIGQPFGTLNDVALVVETLAIGPIMLGSYELGGVTPLWPARFSLASGIAATLVWSAIHLAFIAGLVRFDYAAPAAGAFLAENIALLVVGLWLTGAPPLAGPWLPGRLRVLGALAGLGFVVTALGLILGPPDRPLTFAVIEWLRAAGGIAYLVVFPIWAWLMRGVFSSKATQAPRAG